SDRLRDYPAAQSEFREAIRLKPDDAMAHHYLGIALRNQGKNDKAIAEYREAIRLQPNDASAHYNLGDALRQQGRTEQSMASLERGHELGSRQSVWSLPSEAWYLEARRLAKLEASLPSILKGEVKPTDSAEQLALGVVLYRKGFHAVLARLAERAFAENPALA